MNRQQMNRQRQSYFRLLVALFLVTAVVYGCAQSGDDTAAPGDAVEAATATVPAEPAATPTEDQSQANNEAVQQSKSVQAADTKGITVTSDEDVTTPRTHAGGEYHDVATSDAVSFHPYLTTDTGSSGYQAMVWTGGLLRLDEN
ncbi:MAG: hypothetical protein KDE58_04130, partial [Caldilineaceae bacterium]|nr:hypothetical protein [Caldilineaceae bacterium]